MSRPMKDSGIAWVNKIPSDWDIHPLYYYFAERNRPNRRGKENNLLSLSYGKIIKKDINTCEGLLPASYNSYNIIDPLDIVLRLTDLQNDKRSLRTGLSHERGIITSAYVTLKPSRQVCPAFFHYLLHAYDVEKVLYNMGNGVRQSLNYAELSKLPLIEPPIPEQQRIAEYLDKKCAEIDTLSNSIQQQIDTLEQYKRAVITETVTKGLHPSVPLKDSGIAWLGQIPSVWDIHPLYYYFSERTHPNRFGKENNLLSLSYGKIIKKDINTCEGLLPASYNSYNIIDPMDIVLRLTDLQNDKRSLRTGLSHDRGIITSAYVTLKPARQVYSAFFHYLLHAYDVKKVLYNMGNGVRQSLNYAELSKLPLIEPSLKEQQAIANYLDEKCSKIDAIIQDKQQQLKKLEQYKKATIFEYVTGKKQVPEA